MSNDNKCPLDDRRVKASIASLDAHMQAGCGECLVVYSVATSVTDVANYDTVRCTLDMGDEITVIEDDKYTEWRVFAIHGSPKLFPSLRYSSFFDSDSFSLEYSISKVKAWMDACIHSHKENSCSRFISTPGILPTRVVDVQGANVRLVESVEGQSGAYLALSHCWGETRPPCLTTRATLARNMREIPPDTLAKTFSDAVEVTRALGFRYLWIDSICIIQDDEADWKREASKMASVYQNAVLTLCATAASDDEQGIWPKVYVKDAQKLELKHAGKKYRVYFRTLNDDSNMHLRSGLGDDEFRLPSDMYPLIKRAWTFQERLLSPRLLHFGHAGRLLWQCAQLHDCGCCPDNQRSDEKRDSGIHDLTRTANQDLIRGRWWNLVTTYSGLHMSFSKDTLPALSGLATVFATLRPDDVYLAGLWRSSLAEDLCWITESRRKRARPDIWRAPTWSWASIIGSVAYINNMEDVKIHIQVLDASTELAGPDLFGQVTRGSLQLRGPTVEAVITSIADDPSSGESSDNDPEPFGPIYACQYNVQFTNSSILVRWYADVLPDATFDFDIGTTVVCLGVKTEDKTDLFLLVLLVDGDGIYRRIGFADMSESGEKKREESGAKPSKQSSALFKNSSRDKDKGLFHFPYLGNVGTLISEKTIYRV